MLESREGGGDQMSRDVHLTTHGRKNGSRVRLIARVGEVGDVAATYLMFY